MVYRQQIATSKKALHVGVIIAQARKRAGAAVLLGGEAKPWPMPDWSKRNMPEVRGVL